jgi:hypothetical protein
MDMASQNRDTSLPVTAMTAVAYEKLVKLGHGDEDISALYRLKSPSTSTTDLRNTPGGNLSTI